MVADIAVRPQLKMLWPDHLKDVPPDVKVPSGYTLRTYQSGDEAGFYKVMSLAGFEGWNDETLKPWLLRILPDGWFLAVDQTNQEVVATAMANHHPAKIHPFAGELSWVAAHPDHAHKGLGLAVCGAVVRRLLQAGYHHIYLNTDDWRLPAIVVYLRLGWVPFLYAEGMIDRWQVVYQQLNWPFTPDEWPRL